ncbi:MAG: PIN domain-containing protein [Patescibacteria group bacterium]
MPKQTYFIDTTIFLQALVAEDKKKSAECRKLLQHIRDYDDIDAWTSSLVVAEIEWICQHVYKLDRKTLDEIVRSILSLRNVKILQRIDLRHALDVYDRFRMKFLESLIASNASLIGEHPMIISYDRDFDKIGIPRVTPKEVLEPKRLKTLRKKKN